MPSYLIEVTQRADGLSRRRIDRAVAVLGSHFVTHASWQHSGEWHVGSMVVDCDHKAEALRFVPPCLRAFARVTRLVRAKAAA